MMVSKRWIGRALALLLAGGLMVSAATAGKNQQGGRVTLTGNEKCWVDPSPVSDGQQYTVFGSGFKPGLSLGIKIGDGGYLLTSTDAVGVFSAWDWASFRDPAAITVKVYQSGDRKMTVLATCSLQALGR